MVALSAVRAGASVRILKLAAEPDICRRLREMGLGENAVVRCLQGGAACVCQVRNARVGLGGQLAGLILVEPLS